MTVARTSGSRALRVATAGVLGLLLGVAGCGGSSGRSKSSTTPSSATRSIPTTAFPATTVVPPSSAGLAAKLVAPTDLGTGWTASPARLDTAATLDTNAFSCAGTMVGIPGKVGQYVGAAEIDFTHGTDAMTVSEQLYSSEPTTLSGLLESFRQVVAHCPNAAVTDGSGAVTSAVVAPLPLTKVGADQVAYSLSFVVSGRPASVSIVMVRKGNIGLTVSEATVGTPDLKGLADIARFALTRL